MTRSEARSRHAPSGPRPRQHGHSWPASVPVTLQRKHSIRMERRSYPVCGSTRACRSYSSTSSGRYRTARPIFRNRGPTPLRRHDRTVNRDTPKRAATSISVSVPLSVPCMSDCSKITRSSSLTGVQGGADASVVSRYLFSARQPCVVDLWLLSQRSRLAVRSPVWSQPAHAVPCPRFSMNPGTTLDRVQRHSIEKFQERQRGRRNCSVRCAPSTDHLARLGTCSRTRGSRRCPSNTVPFVPRDAFQIISWCS